MGQGRIERTERPTPGALTKTRGDPQPIGQGQDETARGGYLMCDQACRDSSSPQLAQETGLLLECSADFCVRSVLVLESTVELRDERFGIWSHESLLRRMKTPSSTEAACRALDVDCKESLCPTRACELSGRRKQHAIKPLLHLGHALVKRVDIAAQVPERGSLVERFAQRLQLPLDLR